MHHDNIEAPISSSVSQCSTTGRRRKGTSLGGALATRSARTEAKELRSALQDREAVIQNLRIQLCLGKLPRPTGPPLDESEKPAAEQKLNKLKAEAENKKIKIKNLKGALEKLDITDNIDIRIRQAELEYALGREELQLLSIVEEARALQARLDKSKPEAQSLYTIITSGVTLSLHAIQATSGRWAGAYKPEHLGFYVEWALEGDGLYKGDRILEINGKLVTCKTKEELQKLVGSSGKCQMVILRKKGPILPQKQLDQEKENNMRLQHRISYLEEQVKELQAAKEMQVMQQQQKQIHQQIQATATSTTATNGHVTSISISSSSPSPTSVSSSPTEPPLVFQRGSYITTLVGGKPIELGGDENDGFQLNINKSKSSTTTINNNYLSNTLGKMPKSRSTAHITKTLIKENTNLDLTIQRTPFTYMPSKSLSASKISINSDSAYVQQQYRREKDKQRERYEKASSRSKLIDRSNIQARSVEHLNHCNTLERSREQCRPSGDTQTLRARLTSDMRSVKSLDFDSETDSKPSSGSNSSDSTSQTKSSTARPTPPKKPLRLSLQRAQSLQTVEILPGDFDRKRPLKRVHINNNTLNSINVANKSLNENEKSGMLNENCAPLQTASLGRQKHL